MVVAAAFLKRLGYILLALHAIKSIKNANDLINKISNIFFGGFDRSMFFHLVLRCGRY